MLDVQAASVHYGPVRAVRGVDLTVEEGEFVALLGPNGAGKTSLLSAIAGLRPLASGEVRFDDMNLTNAAPDRIVRSGISLVPEGRRVFVGLSVEENLRLGGATRRGDQADTIGEMFELFPVLAERREQAAESLSGGEQQMLAIARALMAHPRLLVLDEPSLGLAPVIVDTVYRLLAQLREEGQTVLVVEQHTDRALSLADRVYLLAAGEIQQSGSADEFRGSSLLQSYLGV